MKHSTPVRKHRCRDNVHFLLRFIAGQGILAKNRCSKYCACKARVDLKLLQLKYQANYPVTYIVMGLDTNSE